MKSGKIDISDPYIQMVDSAFGIAVGGDATRHNDPEHGMLRYNSRRNILEGFISNTWSELVTDHVMGGGKNLDPADGNVTRQALQNIMSQLFSTSEGSVFVQYGRGYETGNTNGDVLVNKNTLSPLPLISTSNLGYMEQLALNASNITPLGLRDERGQNYIYCIAPTNPSQTITGGFKIDFAKYFRFSEGPTTTIVSAGGTGANIIVASQAGKINRYAIAAAGTGYTIGDTVSINPGKLHVSGTYVTRGLGAVLKVSAVDSTTRGITEIEIIEPGLEYPPHSRWNYIYDTVSGLGGLVDGTGGCGAFAGDGTNGTSITFHMHMVPAWATSPTNLPRSELDRQNNIDNNLLNNIDPNYGKFQIVMDAKFLKQGSISGKYLVTAYKFKEYSNLQ